jgi:SAM-dependent methyltransferase
LAPAGSETHDLDWEGRYQLGDTPWDKGHAAPPLLDFLSRQPIQGEVLILGCGTGHDVRAIAAQASQETKIIGLDLSETAIHRARQSPLLGNENYEQRDLFDLPSSWRGRFDWVIEHTCFCAIAPSRRADYLRETFKTLKPGGHFFAIFYLTPDTQEGPPFGVTKAEIADLFDPGFSLLEEWVPTQTFAGREERELCQLLRKKS